MGLSVVEANELREQDSQKVVFCIHTSVQLIQQASFREQITLKIVISAMNELTGQGRPPSGKCHQTLERLE